MCFYYQYLTKRDNSIIHVESEIEQSTFIKMEKSVMCNIYYVLLNALKRASSIWSDNQTHQFDKPMKET